MKVCQPLSRSLTVCLIGRLAEPEVSQKVLQDCNEMIQDTAYNFEVQFHRVDEKMAQITTDNASILDSTVDLNDLTKSPLTVASCDSQFPR